tara:strand:- start:180 stop:830 length:651 start_codon:yes stop_codon:yes gene_type:complete
MKYSLRKTKKILLEYEILSMELEDSKTLYDKYESIFLEEVFKYIDDNNIVDESENTDIYNKENKCTQNVGTADSGNIEDEEIDYTESKNNLDDDIKKVYKKIAVKIHPDKNINKDEKIKTKYKELYNDLQNAVKSSNYLKIIKIANELNIDIPELNEDIILKIQNILSEMKTNIDSYKNKYPWIWFNSTDEEKEIHIKEFLETNKDNINNIMKYKI